ncbi:MAG: triose-phosphate isomerase [Bacteroidales bacterium]|jgi:triosephosphate isomerase|nr:triose-phosphate isomerase [Bacteroidales bacterium]
MNPKVIVANWKMNKSFEEAEDLISEIAEAIDQWTLQTQVVICPPFPYLELGSDHADESQFSCGAQNCSEFDNGAYTGEVSAEMLEGLEVDFCIVGHSERRAYFNETNVQIAKKIDQLLKRTIIPIVCCGEKLEERNNNNHFDIVKSQIEETLFHLDNDMMENVIIAYEPIWAIGTGVNATPAQAQEMHAFIRSLIEKKYGTQIAYNLPILYGGSCNPMNALELFTQNDIDGGLIGGASLKAENFLSIIEAAETVIKEN